MQNVGPDDSQGGINIARRNMNNLKYADYTTLMAESEEDLKSLLMKVKEESEKAGLNSAFKKLRPWHLVPSVQFISVSNSVVSDSFIQLSHPLLSPSPPAFNLSQHQGLFK